MTENHSCTGQSKSEQYYLAKDSLNSTIQLAINWESISKGSKINTSSLYLPHLSQKCYKTTPKCYKPRNYIKQLKNAIREAGLVLWYCWIWCHVSVVGSRYLAKLKIARLLSSQHVAIAGLQLAACLLALLLTVLWSISMGKEMSITTTTIHPHPTYQHCS